MSKVCPNCQNTIEQDDRAFCPHCGYAFDMDVRLAMQMQRMLKEQAQEKTIKKEHRSDEAPMRPIVTKNEEEDFSKLHRTQKKSSPLPIIIGILFVIVIIAVIFLLK